MIESNCPFDEIRPEDYCYKHVHTILPTNDIQNKNNTTDALLPYQNEPQRIL